MIDGLETGQTNLNGSIDSVRSYYDLKRINPDCIRLEVHKDKLNGTDPSINFYDRSIKVIYDDRVVGVYPSSINHDPRYLDWDTSDILPKGLRDRVVMQHILQGEYFGYCWYHRNPGGGRYEGILVTTRPVSSQGEDVRCSSFRRVPMSTPGTHIFHTDVGINIHKGGLGGTTATGCITIWPPCYEAFIEQVYKRDTWISLAIK